MNTQREDFEKEARNNNKSSIAEISDLLTEEAIEEFQCNVLSVDKTEVYDVCTGTGGPASGFRIYVTIIPNGEKELSHATAYFQNWGTEKFETPLTDAEAAKLLQVIYIEGLP